MQVTETNAEGLKHDLKVVVPADEMEQKLESRLAQLRHQVRLPGFRPGKAPVSLLKKRYGDAVMGEVVENAVSEGSSQALNERGLKPALQPKVEITSFDQGSDLEFTIEVEVIPEIEPMDFGTLELERLVVEVDNREVEEALARLAQERRTTAPVATPRPAKEGDVLVVDFVGRVDGNEFAGGKAEDYSIELGSGAFLPGFEDQLLGASPGDDVKVKVTFPEQYGNKELAGKPAEFDVKVKELQEPVAAAIDDELAKSMGAENLDDLRRQVRERISAQYGQMARARLKRQLLDRLAEGHDFAVPAGMVDMEFDNIWQQLQRDRDRGEQPEEDKGKDEDQLREEYRAIAERRVRLGLLLSHVGEQNNIQLSQDEVNRAMIGEAQRFPGQERQVLEHFQNNPEAAANLRAPLFEDKVVDFILELATVKERKLTVDELIAEMEAETETAPARPGKKKAAGKSTKSGGAKAGTKAGKSIAGSAKGKAASPRGKSGGAAKGKAGGDRKKAAGDKG